MTAPPLSQPPLSQPPLSQPPWSQKVAMLAAPLLARYQRLGRRERALILATVIAAGAFSWDQLIFERQRQALSEVSSQIDRSSVLLGQARAVAAGLAVTTSDTRRAALQKQRSTAIAANAKQQLALSQAMAGFVQSADVSQLLADVLKRHPGLRLIKAESVAPRLLGATDVASDDSAEAAAAKAAAAPAVSKTQLYQHGLKLELEGSYLDAYDYLHELERLPWGIRWDRISFEVTEHPVGRLVLQLHTVSQGPEWIGV